MIIVGIIVAIVIAIIVWFISISNTVNRAFVKIDESKSAIEIQLQKRYDVLTQSMDIAKGFATHEKDIFTSLRQVNSGMSINDLNEITQEQAQAITKLVALGEAYPELKSSELFSNLQVQLSEENAQFAASKRAFNANVTSFNNICVSFPTSIVCSMKGKSKLDYIKEDNIEAKKDINMSWN